MDMISLDIENPFRGAPVYFRGETDSTMNDAYELCRRGALSGTVVAAGYQTAGRGRFRSRRWESNTGDSLLFTLILDRNVLAHPLGVLPLLSGLGVALFVKALSGQNCNIKWPNDILVDGRKISGILCESRAGRLLVGVGLNCMQNGFPAYPNLEATSLRLIGVNCCEPLNILEDVLRNIKTGFGINDALERIRGMLYRSGRSVVIATGLPGKERRIRGTLTGLGDEGQLTVREQLTGDMLDVFSGEIEIDQELPPGSV